MLPHVLAPPEEMVVNVSYTGVTPGEDLESSASRYRRMG